MLRVDVRATCRELEAVTGELAGNRRRSWSTPDVSALRWLEPPRGLWCAVWDAQTKWVRAPKNTHPRQLVVERLKGMLGALRGNTSVREVRIRNGCAVRLAGDIFKALEGHPSLTRLQIDVVEGRVNKRDFWEPLFGLLRAGRLRALDLGNFAAQDPVPLHRIAKLFDSIVNCAELEELGISMAEGFDSPRAISLFAATIRRLRHLTSLDLVDTLSDLTLFDACGTLNLRTLHVGGELFRLDHRSVAPGIAFCRNLDKLDVWGATGPWTDLFSATFQLPNLTCLLLVDCTMHDFEIRLFFDLLRQNRTITDATLRAKCTPKESTNGSNEYIHATAGLSETLRQNATLRSLDLYVDVAKDAADHFYRDMWVELNSGLAANTALVDLAVDGDYHLIDRFAEVVGAHPTLQSIFLDDERDFETKQHAAGEANFGPLLQMIGSGVNRRLSSVVLPERKKGRRAWESALAEALRGNGNVWHAWPSSAIVERAIELNVARQTRWVAFAPLIAFVRAHPNHPFQTSIIPLLPHIAALMDAAADEDEKKPAVPSGVISAFLATKFAAAHHQSTFATNPRPSRKRKNMSN